MKHTIVILPVFSSPELGKGARDRGGNKVIHYPFQRQSLFLSLSALSYRWLYANKLLTVTSPWNIHRGHHVTFFNISIYQNGTWPGILKLIPRSTRGENKGALMKTCTYPVSYYTNEGCLKFRSDSRKLFLARRSGIV